LQPAARLAQGLNETVVEARPGELVLLDVADLFWCDSTGLSSTLRLYRQVAAIGAQLAVCAPPPYLADLLAMTALDNVLRVRQHRPALI